MQEDFIDYLHNAAPLVALLASHTVHGTPLINWVTRPDKEDLPALTLTVVSPIPNYDQGGRVDLESVRIQCDFWSDLYSEGRSISKAFRDFIDPRDTEFTSFTHGSTFFHRVTFETDGRDLPVADLPGGGRVHPVTSDIVVWHKPA